MVSSLVVVATSLVINKLTVRASLVAHRPFSLRLPPPPNISLEESVECYQTLCSWVGSGHETTSQTGESPFIIFCLLACLCVCLSGNTWEEPQTLLDNTVTDHTYTLPHCCLQSRFDTKLNLIIGSYVVYTV